MKAVTGVLSTMNLTPLSGRLHRTAWGIPDHSVSLYCVKNSIIKYPNVLVRRLFSVQPHRGNSGFLVPTQLLWSNPHRLHIKYSFSEQMVSQGQQSHALQPSFGLLLRRPHISSDKDHLNAQSPPLSSLIERTITIAFSQNDGVHVTSYIGHHLICSHGYSKG